MINKLIIIISKLLILFSKGRKKIVYHSFSDFSDNSFAMFLYVNANHKEYKNIWLVDNYSKKENYIKLARKYGVNDEFIILKKKSLKSVFYYLTADYVFHTHGLFNLFGLIPNQKKINLWHGMPLKNIGYLDDKNSSVQTSNRHISTSPFFQDIIRQAFGVTNDEVLVVGQPRNDLLFDKISLNTIFNKKKFTKTILWMPTYRKSIVGDIREDGNISIETDFLNESSLFTLNKHLQDLNTICYVKIHPMDYRKKTDFKLYNNIVFIDNDDFENKEVSLYSVLSSIDILLTDFSSIYIDFLLLDKPIGFVFSDFEEYTNSRGFVFSNPIEYMPGEIITTIDELNKFIKNVLLDKKDNYKDKRKKITKLFHSYDKNFSKIIFQKINNA